MTTDALFDLDLEMALVSEAIFDHGRYVTYGIAVAHYASDRARRLVEAAEELWRETGEVSLEGVTVLLQRAGKLASLGGLDGLAGDLGMPKVPVDPEQLRTLAALRAVRDDAVRVIAACTRQDMAGAIAGLADGQAHALDTSTIGQVKTAYELVCGTLEHFQAGARTARIHPGFAPLYDAVGDLPIGSVTVIVANTNVGKSAVTLEMLLAASARNVGAGLISAEDPEEVTGTRLLSAKSGVDGRDIHRGRITREQWSSIAGAAESIRVSNETLLFAQCVGGTDVDACSAISRMASRGARLVAVDYLGVLNVSGKTQDRRNELRIMLGRLKAHAARSGVALVLVSQITRPPDKNPNKPPTKHDLKESGDLENGAECIIGLWREDEHDHAPVRARILKSKIGGNGVEWMMQRSKRDGRLRVVTAVEVEQW